MFTAASSMTKYGTNLVKDWYLLEIIICDKPPYM